MQHTLHFTFAYFFSPLFPTKNSVFLSVCYDTLCINEVCQNETTPMLDAKKAFSLFKNFFGIFSSYNVLKNNLQNRETKLCFAHA